MSNFNKSINNDFKNCRRYPKFTASCCPTPNPPASKLSPTFGSLYGDGISRSAILDVNLEFDFSGPISNTIADPSTNSIKILISGIYEISTSVATYNSGSGGPGVIYQIRRNNFRIEGAEFESTIPMGAVTIATTIQTALVAGDVLTVAPGYVNGSVEYLMPTLTVNLIG